MRIAFAGNPNSGKTTMFNALTGSNERVGNWAGVTVDRKEAPIKKLYAGDLELTAVDLPGTFIPVEQAEIVASFDHRVVDGGDIGRLMQRIAYFLEHPEHL